MTSNIAINTLRYLNSDELILKNFTLSLEQGEIIGLIGPNACGKTTLLKHLAQVTMASFVHEVDDNHNLGVDIQFGYVQQGAKRSIMGWLSAIDNVALPGELAGKSREKARGDARAVLDRVGATDRLEYHQLGRFLSGGQAQLVALAREMSRNPDLLLIDEGFAPIDFEIRFGVMYRVRQWAKENQRCIVFVSHHLDETVFFADRVAILSQKPCAVIHVVEVDNTFAPGKFVEEDAFTAASTAIEHRFLG